MTCYQHICFIILVTAIIFTMADMAYFSEFQKHLFTQDVLSEFPDIINFLKDWSGTQ